MSKMIPFRRHTAAALASAIVLAGCITPTGLDDPEIWEATLRPVEGSSVGGQAAAVARDVTIQVGIGIIGADPQSQYRWAIHTGGCESLDAMVGNPASYPLISTADLGAGESEALVAGTLRIDREYSVLVETEPGEPVACGALEHRPRSELDF